MHHLTDPTSPESVDVRRADGFGGTFYGVYPAIVKDLNDPEGEGRIRVRLPWSPDPDEEDYEAWARLATMLAGKGFGSWFRPDVGDEVLVAFEGGNPRRPYVVGGLWNGKDLPNKDVRNDTPNNVKEIRTKSGARITIDDTDGSEKITIKTPGGHEITMDDSDRKLRLSDSNNSTVEMGPSGVSINTGGKKLDITASDVTISASAVNVNAGMASFSGVVQVASMMNASTVVAATYTPGAGNIL